MNLRSAAWDLGCDSDVGCGFGCALDGVSCGSCVCEGPSGGLAPCCDFHFLSWFLVALVLSCFVDLVRCLVGCLVRMCVVLSGRLVGKVNDVMSLGGLSGVKHRLKLTCSMLEVAEMMLETDPSKISCFLRSW